MGETGLYNLTQDESPALIHIGKDKTQQWTLVRLKQPEQTAARTDPVNRVAQIAAGPALAGTRPFMHALKPDDRTQ